MLVRAAALPTFTFNVSHIQVIHAYLPCALHPRVNLTASNHRPRSRKWVANRRAAIYCTIKCFSLRLPPQFIVKRTQGAQALHFFIIQFILISLRIFLSVWILRFYFFPVKNTFSFEQISLFSIFLMPRFSITSDFQLKVHKCLWFINKKKCTFLID